MSSSGPIWARLPEPPDADRRRMLAKDEGRPALLSQIVDDAPLKLLDLQKVDQPQHVNFQRRQLRGWPHRLSGHRAKKGSKTVSVVPSIGHCISLKVPALPAVRQEHGRAFEATSPGREPPFEYTFRPQDWVPSARSRSYKRSATVSKPGSTAIRFSDLSHFSTFRSADMTVAWLRPPK